MLAHISIPEGAPFAHERPNGETDIWEGTCIQSSQIPSQIPEYLRDDDKVILTRHHKGHSHGPETVMFTAAQFCHFSSTLEA